QLTPLGSPPEKRFGHRALYDPAGDRMIVFGGLDGAAGASTVFNDVWALSLSGTPEWTPIVPQGAAPPPRHFHSLEYDPVRGRAIVYGGVDAKAASYSDCWELTLVGAPAWVPLSPSNPGPQPLYGHLGLIDPDSDRMLIAWGWNQDGVWPSTYRLQWYDPSMALAVSVLSAEAQAGGVALRWQAHGTAGTPARIDRRGDGDAWTTLDRQALDATQEVSYVDRDVRPGQHLGYRLVVEGDLPRESEVTWVDVPARASVPLLR